MDFQCNVCGQMATDIPIEKIDREVSSCPHCHSSVRFRSIVHLLSLSLFGRSIALPDFPQSPDITGIGLSDWDGYAVPLADKVNYINTYYHQEPFFDVCKPVGARSASYDFMISTEVFEHVPPPAQIAFQHAFDVLKPGGTLILTVPFGNDPATREHFPDLHEFQIVQFADKYVLVNHRVDGQVAVHENLVFHGGPGSTLEMRVYARNALQRHLTDAGFTDIRFIDENVPHWGIIHKYPWSLPILAKRPGTIPAPAAPEIAQAKEPATPPADAPSAAEQPQSSTDTSNYMRASCSLPPLFLAAAVVLGLFALMRSNRLVEMFWSKPLVDRTGYLTAGIGSLAILACFAAAYVRRRSDSALPFLLLAFTFSVCGPAPTLIALLFLLSSWCLGTILLQHLRPASHLTSTAIVIIVGWSIYAIVFPLIASLRVNFAATYAVLAAIPIAIAAAMPDIHGRLRRLLTSAFSRRSD